MASSKSASRKGQRKSRSNSSGSQAAASRSSRPANGTSRRVVALLARLSPLEVRRVGRGGEGYGDRRLHHDRCPQGQGPMLAAGATAAGLAAGLALGSRTSSKRRGVGALLAPQRKVLGVPVGARKSAVVRTAEALGESGA